MALYGNNLAKTIRDGITWLQATDVLGQIEDGLRACYSSLSLWDNWKANGTLDTINLTVLSAIVPDDARAIKIRLDDDYAATLAFDTMVQERMGEFGEDAPLSEDYLSKLRARVSVASGLIALVDDLFHTSVITQVSDAIVPVVGDIGDKVGNALSKLVGNFLAGIWWLIALALVGLWMWSKWGPKASKAAA